GASRNRRTAANGSAAATAARQISRACSRRGGMKRRDFEPRRHGDTEKAHRGRVERKKEGVEGIPISCSFRSPCLRVSVVQTSSPSPVGAAGRAPRRRVSAPRRRPAAGVDVIPSNCDAEVWPGDPPPPYDTIKQRLADCDGLVALLTDRVDSALLDAAPRLKVVSNYAVGFNHIDLPAATQRGIAVGQPPRVLADAPPATRF